MLNKLTKHRQMAIDFIKFVNRPENQKKLCLASGRIPSRYDTLDQLKDQEAIQKFAKAAEYGMPMPNHPVLNAVWGPMGETLKMVIEDGKDPAEVLPIEVKRIQNDIKVMME